MAKTAAVFEQELRDAACECTSCPALVNNRQQVVFASGPASARLMFVGEAPGANEDREGAPFIGASGRLLDELLESIEMKRDEVYITNVVKCRPPANRDPLASEIENCAPFLRHQIELVAPIVVVTLGNFATRLLRGDAAGITTIHGQPERRSFGERAVWLFPVFHPAAALYRRPNLQLLREDFARLPVLVHGGPPMQTTASDRAATDMSVERGAGERVAVSKPPQLDLF